jgi:hypothetical protein
MTPDVQEPDTKECAICGQAVERDLLACPECGGGIFTVAKTHATSSAQVLPRVNGAVDGGDERMPISASRPDDVSLYNGANADQAESTSVNPFLFWLRWLGVLPAALVAVVAVSFPVHWCVLMIAYRGGEDQTLGLSSLPPETLERLGQAFFAPLAFIYVGAKVAPAFRLHTALALMILWAMVVGAGLTYATTVSAYEGWGWAEFAAVGVLGVAGLVAGGYAVYQNLWQT